jgi:hypothetical protein
MREVQGSNHTGDIAFLEIKYALLLKCQSLRKKERKREEKNTDWCWWSLHGGIHNTDTKIISIWYPHRWQSFWRFDEGEKSCIRTDKPGVYIFMIVAMLKQKCFYNNKTEWGVLKHIKPLQLFGMKGFHWVNDCCLTTSERFFSYIMARKKYISIILSCYCRSISVST